MQKAGYPSSIQRVLELSGYPFFMYSYLTINLMSQFATSNARTPCRQMRRIQLIHRKVPVIGCAPQHRAQLCGIWHALGR